MKILEQVVNIKLWPRNGQSAKAWAKLKRVRWLQLSRSTAIKIILKNLRIGGTLTIRPRILSSSIKTGIR